MNSFKRTLTALGMTLALVAAPAWAQTNSSSVSQTGNGNSAVVEQEYITGGSGMNEALITQINTGGATADGNTVFKLAQAGSGNLFDVYQEGTNNIVRSYPAQGTSSRPSYDGMIDIDQFGDGNEVWDADQSEASNALTIVQEGDGNFVDFEAQVSTGAMGNMATITQLGSGNTVGQAGSGLGAYQEGDGNTMMITQNGDNNEAGTMVSPHLDGAKFDPEFKFGGPFPEGGQSIVQFGMDNTMTITQSGGDVVGYALQDGIGNTMTILQDGGDNYAGVSQVGNGNTAIIDQTSY